MFRIVSVARSPFSRLLRYLLANSKSILAPLRVALIWAPDPYTGRGVRTGGLVSVRTRYFSSPFSAESTTYTLCSP